MVAPSKFAHVVYNTHRFEEMIDWYARVFEARIQHRDDRLAFLTYDDEHHRFAFINLGPAAEGAIERQPGDAGVNHVAYTWRNLGELLDTYKRLKDMGVAPYRPIRHGLTLSMYYRDPDGNGLEFQIDAMDLAAAGEFMRSETFARDPVGQPFDPDDDLVFRSDQPESGGTAFRRTGRAA